MNRKKKRQAVYNSGQIINQLDLLKEPLLHDIIRTGT